MTIHSDIVAALASVASGRVYPDAAPQDAVLPFVVYRRVSKEPLNTLYEATGYVRSSFVFDCWATTKAAAITTAAAVVTAIEAAAALNMAFEEPVTGEDYEPAVDQFVEPVQFGFWHQ